MKKLIAMIVLSVLIAGCQIQASNAFVGTWTYSEVGPTCTFSADGTFAGIVPDFDRLVMQVATGSYAFTADRLDLILADGGSISMLYAMSGPTAMIWTPLAGGFSIELSKR